MVYYRQTVIQQELNLKNNMKKYLKVIIAISLIIVVGLFALKGFENDKNNIVLSQVKVSKSVQIDKCNDEALKFIDKWKRDSIGLNNKYYKQGNQIFKFNYNQVSDSCYVLVNDESEMKDKPDGSYSSKINYILIDIFKNDPSGNYLRVGNYAQSTSYSYEPNGRLDSCNVAGLECGSLEGFLSLIKPYIDIDK